MTDRNLAKIGVLVPFTNTNLEPDLQLMAVPGMVMHVTRMGGYDEDEIPDEEQMAGLGAADLETPLHLLQGVKPDVILYGCTSATLSHGPGFDRDLADRIKSQSGAHTVTAAGALCAALRALEVTKIGFASPYVASLNDKAIAFLADEGFDTVSRADFDGVLDNAGQGALTPADVFDLGLRADSPDADAIVLSCTDMRSVETIQKLEEAIGKPVVTSNQAMMFQTLQILDVGTAPTGFGCLLERAG